MRRKWNLVIPAIVFLLACRAVSFPIFFSSPPASPSPLPTVAAKPSSTVPAARLSPTPYTPRDESFLVLLHPDGELYVGDLVSLEIIALPGASLDERPTHVQVSGSSGIEIDQTSFGPYGIAKRYQATLFWAWDTAGLEPGEHTLTFSIHPVGPRWTQTVTLLPSNAMPKTESQAHWTLLESACCVVYTITGTAAERDLPLLIEEVSEQAHYASQSLGFDFEEPVPIVFLPRVMGHGGFSSEEISISYLDRNYAGSSLEMVLRHEIIHQLDSRLGGELRPTLLVEGLAVYLSGGHFKAEELMPRAAALLELEWYLPLVTLVEDFYLSQHEISYMEAGSLVEYMVETWGWEAFSNFYRDIHPVPVPTKDSDRDERVESSDQTRALEVALQAHFNLTLSDLEGRFLKTLGAQPLTPSVREDVRLTVGFYDTVRRYQQTFDPSSYFLTAWLPDVLQMRQRGIVADYLRHPSTLENLALETLLVTADSQLRAANYTKTGQVLDAINTVLDAVDQGNLDPFSVHALAADYFSIVRSLEALGYQPHRIQLNDNLAQVWVSTTGPNVVEVELIRDGNEWVIGGGDQQTTQNRLTWTP